MPPRNYAARTLQDWVKAEIDKTHSMAIKYIEENVDLIDTDLQKFMNNCPTICQLEVYEMLRKAGIDVRECVMNSTLKKWDHYIHDANPHLHQYYTIEYKKEIDDFIKETLTWKTDWLVDALEEA